MAAPRPDAAPVTTATLFANRFMVKFSEKSPLFYAKIYGKYWSHGLVRLSHLYARINFGVLEMTKRLQLVIGPK